MFQDHFQSGDKVPARSNSGKSSSLPSVAGAKCTTSTHSRLVTCPKLVTNARNMTHSIHLATVVGVKCTGSNPTARTIFSTEARRWSGK